MIIDVFDTFKLTICPAMWFNLIETDSKLNVFPFFFKNCSKESKIARFEATFRGKVIMTLGNRYELKILTY